MLTPKIYPSKLNRLYFHQNEAFPDGKFTIKHNHDEIITKYDFPDINLTLNQDSDR